MVFKGKVVPPYAKRASLTLRMESCQCLTPWRTSSMYPSFSSPLPLTNSLSLSFALFPSFLSFFSLSVPHLGFLSSTLTSRLAPKRRHPALAWTRPAASDLFSVLCPSVHWRLYEPHARCAVTGMVGRARCAVRHGAV